jgi:hypothetical protein
VLGCCYINSGGFLTILDSNALIRQELIAPVEFCFRSVLG